MKKIIINLGTLFLIFLLIQANLEAQPCESLFEDAKILIFDMKWEAAQKKLDELLEKCPGSVWYSQAVFYKAKCLEEQKGKELEALNNYLGYIELKDTSASLAQEAEISVIKLAYKLYEKGNRFYLQKIEDRLSSSNKQIRYFAAFQLSYVKDKRAASKAIPVLKDILERERDEELKDRAKIALLRVDPNALTGFEERRYERKAKVLNIEIYKEGKRAPAVKIRIPWALAELALSAISEEDRMEMKKKGYGLDRIIKELTEVQGNIIEIEGEDGTIFKIWID